MNKKNKFNCNFSIKNHSPTKSDNFENKKKASNENDNM